MHANRVLHGLGCPIKDRMRPPAYRCSAQQPELDSSQSGNAGDCIQADITLFTHHRPSIKSNWTWGPMSHPLVPLSRPLRVDGPVFLPNGYISQEGGLAPIRKNITLVCSTDHYNRFNTRDWITMPLTEFQKCGTGVEIASQKHYVYSHLYLTWGVSQFVTLTIMLYDSAMI